MNKIDEIKAAQGDRIVEERTRLKMSATEFIQKMDKGKSTVYNWLNGVSSPEGVDFFRMAEIGMDINYIISGLKKSTDIAEDFVYVPVRPVEICAGTGVDAEDHQPDYYHAFRKNWVSYHGYDPKKLSIIKVKGDSMAPVLQSGDYIVINEASNEPKTGCIFAVRIGHELLAKYIEVQHNGNLVLKSRNSFYSDITLTPSDLVSSDIQVIGEIVQSSRDLR